MEDLVFNDVYLDILSAITFCAKVLYCYALLTRLSLPKLKQVYFKRLKVCSCEE